MANPSNETVRFNELKWLSPVETVDDLPEAEGEQALLCYVQTEDAVYQRVNGIWVKGADISAHS